MAKHKAVWRSWQFRVIALSLTLSLLLVTPLLLPGASQPAPSKPASSPGADPASLEVGPPPYTHRYNPEPDPVPGEMLVRFKAPYIAPLHQALVAANRFNPEAFPSLTGARIDANHLYEVSPELKAFLNTYRVWAADAIIPESGTYRLKFDPIFEPRATVSDFEGSGFFDYAEPNFPVYAFREPNDPLYRTQQWSLKQINAPETWDITTGTDNITIAIVDSGILTTHPDLTGKVLNGMNFSAEPANSKAIDDNGHGTYVAGIAAANSNNAIGIAGVSWNARLLPVKVLDADGVGTNATIAMGIKYALEQKVQIINISLGGPERARVVEDVVRGAFNQGIVVVASVGNTGTNQPTYPAAFEGVIGVGAFNQQGEAASFSNFGPELSITAPGVNIVGPSVGSPAYISDSGTSSAAPFVSGAAALMLSVNRNLSNIQLRNILEGTADNFRLTDMPPATGSVRANSITAKYDTRLGWGRLNLLKAVQAAQRGTYYPSMRGRIQGFISGLDPLDTTVTLQPGDIQVPDASGFYAFTNLPPGSYNLKIESKKYGLALGPDSFQVRGSDGEVYSQDYDLEQQVKDVLDAGPPVGAFRSLSPGLGLTTTPTRRYFPATGHTIQNKFLQFWLDNGDLQVFGYPISQEFQEANPTNNRSYLVQYFERAVFEYHPEYAGTPAEIQLRLLGSELVKGRTDKPFAAALPPALQFIDGKLLNVYYSPETKHSIRGKFLEYWLANGKVPVFGLPISEEMEENGRVVQYFERYRLEIHPENAETPWEVIGSLLARDSAVKRGLLPRPQQ